MQVAAELPAASGTVDIVADVSGELEQLAVVVKKVGDATLSSPQIASQQEFPAEGETYIAGTGGAVPAGQAVRIQVAGLPHHSGAPRIIALALASVIVLAGAWAAEQPDDDGAMRAAERKRLIARREKLFNDLVRLENDRRERARRRAASCDAARRARGGARARLRRARRRRPRARTGRPRGPRRHR